MAIWILAGRACPTPGRALSAAALLLLLLAGEAAGQATASLFGRVSDEELDRLAAEFADLK